MALRAGDHTGQIGDHSGCPEHPRVSRSRFLRGRGRSAEVRPGVASIRRRGDWHSSDLAGDPLRIQRSICHHFPSRARSVPSRLPAVGTLPGQPYRQHRGKQVYRWFPRRPEAVNARGITCIRFATRGEKKLLALVGTLQAGSHFDPSYRGEGVGHLAGLPDPRRYRDRATG